MSRESAVAEQSRLSGTAYRVFEIAALIPTPAYRQAQSGAFYSIFVNPVRNFSRALTLNYSKI
jgi:hypothetical protein